jgi:hypothetical protein
MISGNFNLFFGYRKQTSNILPVPTPPLLVLEGLLQYLSHFGRELVKHCGNDGGGIIIRNLTRCLVKRKKAESRSTVTK